MTVAIMQETWHAEFLIQGTGGQENSIAANVAIPPCSIRVEYNAGAGNSVAAPAGGIAVTYNSILAHTAPITPLASTKVESPPTEIRYDMHYPVSVGSPQSGYDQPDLTFVSELMAALYAQASVSEVYLMFDTSINPTEVVFLASDLGNGNNPSQPNPDLSIGKMETPSFNDMYDFPIELSIWTGGPHLTVTMTAWGSSSTATWGT